MTTDSSLSSGSGSESQSISVQSASPELTMVGVAICPRDLEGRVRVLFRFGECEFLSALARDLGPEDDWMGKREVSFVATVSRINRFSVASCLWSSVRAGGLGLENRERARLGFDGSVLTNTERMACLLGRAVGAFITEGFAGIEVISLSPFVRLRPSDDLVDRKLTWPRNFRHVAS